MAQADSRRLPELELLRALAAQLIVWHHLAYYGPMSDAARALGPGLVDALAEHGRLAVQVFLVLAGFLAARSIGPGGPLSMVAPLPLVWRRAARLLPAYWVALALALAAAAWARQSMSHDVLPAPARVEAVLAHALLLHSVLGIDSLSAGVWYVAIDLQLFALFVGLAWLSQRLARQEAAARPLLALLVVGMAAASMLHFNRDPDWDVWALYFFGSYALGIAAAWLRVPGALQAAALALYLLAFSALVIDFRMRLALALGASLLLAGLARWRLPRWPAALEVAVDFLARTSYATFLLHFPLMLLVAAALQQRAPHSPALNAAGMLLTWLLSLALAAQVQRRVEQPVARWLGRREAAGDLKVS